MVMHLKSFRGVWFIVMLHYVIILRYCNLTLMKSQYKNPILYCLERWWDYDDMIYFVILNYSNVKKNKKFNITLF